MMIDLLPAVDVRDGLSVRLTQGNGDSAQTFGDPREIIAQFVEQGAQWIHLVDLNQAFGQGNNREVLSQIIDEFAPRVKIELSGGIIDDEAVQFALDCHVDRIVIGTAACARMAWLCDVVGSHPSLIAVGLDVKDGVLHARGHSYTGGNLYEAIGVLNDAGCARYVVTDVSRDGMMAGNSRALLLDVASRTSAQITASGGIGSLDDIRELTSLHLRIDSAILGKALYERAFGFDQALMLTRDETLL